MLSILPMIESLGGRSCSCFALASVLLVSFASACSGRPTVVDDADEGTSTSSSTDSGTTSGAMLTDTSDTDGTSGTSGATTDTAGTADSGSSDTGPLVCEPLEDVPDVPAILEVTVEILNDTAGPVYVLEWADACTPYALTRDGRQLPIGAGGACPCECGGPPRPSTTAVALEPGQSLVLTWDGRVMVFYTENFYCEWQGQEWCRRARTAVFQPLAPGPITMTIPIYDEEGYYYQRPGTTTLELIACESPRSFSVDFELGSEDLTIPVALSEVVIQ
jgi:hypothetical protein